MRKLEGFVRKYNGRLRIGVLVGIIVGTTGYLVWDNIIQRDWFLLTAHLMRLLASAVLALTCYGLGRSIKSGH